jgi:hypothetical protein
MKVIKPRNLSGGDGSFPCGRMQGYEAKEFRMPKEPCPDCMVQLEWQVDANKTLTYCADVELT